jgi:heme exporter protein C
MRAAALVFGALGLGLTIFFHWLVFFWVPTEAQQGIVQRIFYIHVAAWWVGFLALGFVAIASAVYLWIGDDKLDRVARASAEGGLLFISMGLLTGPLWARLAWGTWWEWEARLTLALLLWFIYLGYFLVRASTDSPERGKKFAAVVGIVGALNIPIIHVSVLWFRSLHPEPVVLTPDPQIDPRMLVTLLVALLAWTLIFFSFFLLRYVTLQLEAAADRRAAGGFARQGAGG